MKTRTHIMAALALALSAPGVAEAAQHTFPDAIPKPPRKPRDVTDSDRENIAAAQRKRERRALRRTP